MSKRHLPKATYVALQVWTHYHFFKKNLSQNYLRFVVEESQGETSEGSC
jgi:hypothetical protein